MSLKDLIDNNTFIITRHGKTEWNLEGRIQGSLDSPLLSTSGDILRKLGTVVTDRYNIDFAYCSTKKRAKDSFNWAFPNVTPIYDDRLVEIYHGVCEGKLLSDVDPCVISKRKENPWTNPWEGGENYQDVYNRVEEFLKTLSCKDSNILIMGHEGVNKTLLGLLGDFSEDEFVSFKQPNHTCYVVDHGSVKLFDAYGLDCNNIVFKEV